MGLASGKSDMYFGTDLGKWGAEGAGIFFWPAEGKFFFPPTCLCSKCLDFCGEFKKGGKHEKIFDTLTRPPSRPLAAGHPSVTFHSSLREGGTLMCIPGRACVDRSVTCLRPLVQRLACPTSPNPEPLVRWCLLQSSPEQAGWPCCSHSAHTMQSFCIVAVAETKFGGFSHAFLRVLIYWLTNPVFSFLMDVSRDVLESICPRVCRSRMETTQTRGLCMSKSASGCAEAAKVRDRITQGWGQISGDWRPQRWVS